VSGLAAALHIDRLARSAGRPAEVLVLERDARAGGKVLTLAEDGFVVEGGPNGFLDSRQAALDLAEEVGLTGRLLRAADASARRFVWHDGELHPVPSSPPALLRSRLLSWRGKLRLLGEVFCKPPPDGVDETMAEFGRRHIGAEATARLLDPFLTGVFAGDIERTSIAAAFPRIVAVERDHGSLIRGMVHKQRERLRGAGEAGGGGPGGPAGTLTSFPGGMRELTERLESLLPDGALRLGEAVAAVQRGPTGAGGFDLATGSGATLHADRVVLATPAHRTAAVLAPLGDDALVSALSAIPYAPAAVVALGYRRATVAHPLDGFGFLVPRTEGRKVLGMLWSHAVFPGRRAPDDHVLLRAIVGGTRSPELLDLDDAALISTVRAEVDAFAGERGEPVLAKVVRWARAIPQYVTGHLERVAAVESACRQNQGLFVGGNALRGVSLAECAADARSLAEEVVGTLR